MNLFVLDEDTQLAASYYHDTHVKTITKEAAQILSNAYTLRELEEAPKNQKGECRKHSYTHAIRCVFGPVQQRVIFLGLSIMLFF